MAIRTVNLKEFKLGSFSSGLQLEIDDDIVRFIAWQKEDGFEVEKQFHTLHKDELFNAINGETGK